MARPLVLGGENDTIFQAMLRKFNLRRCNLILDLHDMHYILGVEERVLYGKFMHKNPCFCMTSDVS